MATDERQASKGGCSTTMKVLGSVTALITAIAGLIGAFNALSSANPAPPPTQSINQNNLPTTPAVSPTPDATWKVIINSSSTNTTYQGYTANSGYVFLIIDASFENDATTSQVLSGQLFDLQDSSGQHYQESQASDPGQSFAVKAGNSTETETTFVIPASTCNYELSFIASSSIVSQWNINTCQSQSQ